MQKSNCRGARRVSAGPELTGCFVHRLNPIWKEAFAKPCSVEEAQDCQLKVSVGDWDAVHKRASEALAAGHPAQCQLHMLRGEAWLFCGNNVGAMAQFEAAVRAGFGASPGFFAHARSLDRSLASAVARALRYRALLLAWASRRPSSMRWRSASNAPRLAIVGR